MNHRSWVRVLCVAGLVAGLTACAEKPQESVAKRPGTTVTRDTRPWDADSTAYSSAQLKKGDQAAWERTLKDRAQSQNEYTRAH